MIHALHARQIDRYFAGSLRPVGVTRMFRRLWTCTACRARYERYLFHERSLPDGGSGQQDRLWQSILASAGAEVGPASISRPAPPVRRRLSRPATLAGVGAFAGALLLVAAGNRLKAPSAPVARGTADGETAAPTMHLFRSVGAHATESVQRTVHPDDGILIAYSNPGAELSYLMVFAVDVHGDVHWYYPRYEQPGQNPAAPAIRTRALGVELNEEIRHALPVGPLRMFALFLRRPLLVDEVERQVSAVWRLHGESVTALETLPIQDGQQLSSLLEVTP